MIVRPARTSQGIHTRSSEMSARHALSTRFLARDKVPVIRALRGLCQRLDRDTVSRAPLAPQEMQAALFVLNAPLDDSPRCRDLLPVRYARKDSSSRTRAQLPALRAHLASSQARKARMSVSRAIWENTLQASACRRAPSAPPAAFLA